MATARLAVPRRRTVGLGVQTDGRSVSGLAVDDALLRLAADRIL